MGLRRTTRRTFTGNTRCASDYSHPVHWYPSSWVACCWAACSDRSRCTRRARSKRRSVPCLWSKPWSWNDPSGFGQRSRHCGSHCHSAGRMPWRTAHGSAVDAVVPRETYQRLCTARSAAVSAPVAGANEPPPRDEELWNRASVWHLHGTVRQLQQASDTSAVAGLLNEATIQETLVPAARHSAAGTPSGSHRCADAPAARPVVAGRGADRGRNGTPGACTPAGTRRRHLALLDWAAGLTVRTRRRSLSELEPESDAVDVISAGRDGQCAAGG